MHKMLELIGAKKLMKIMELFLENPNKEFYQSEISKITRLSRTTASKWIKVLKENNIVKQESKKIKYYALNKENVIAKQMKILMTVSKLYEAVKEIKNELVEVYLFGSAARGEDAEKSDIDILIIGKHGMKINKFIDLAEKMTKKAVRPTIKTPLEYSRITREDKLFYENIERDKIRLL